MGPPQKVARKVSENVKSPEEDQGRPGRVWVLSPEGKLISVSIVLGITDGTFSEVISGDLQEGGEVVVEEMSNKKAPSQAGNPPFMPGRRR